MEKATLIDYVYDPATDRVFWYVERQTGQKMKLAWTRLDLTHQYNFKFELVPELVEQFCEMMVGKEIPVDFETAGPADPSVLS